ncbi:MAG TPA: DUF2127 domain-containing protein [Solirubrobacteraceae bacterium]|nr:DUF2127 domain-containing protein [Solirubrobacteraceae bacterium]
MSAEASQTPRPRAHTHAPGAQQPRRRRHVDWELVVCGLRGHALVGRDAEATRAQDALLIRDEGELRWHRCLRCDAWVPLARPRPPARPHPPERDEIMLPLRGQALRDKIVLRLIAVDRALHFLVLALLGVAVLLFASDRTSLKSAFYRVLTAIQGGVAGGPVQTSGHVGILHELDRLFSLRTATLRDAGIALLAYALMEGVEAVGLWYAKRWAEYLTFVATTVLLPLEVYEIIHKQSPLKIIGFVLNLAVAIYLLFRKRLFGLRGGAAAEEAQRAADGGWPAIERATPALNAEPAS